MKSVTLAVRESLAILLNPLPHLTYLIPVYEEYVAGDPVELITVGNVEVQAYIVLKNQTQNDASAKCVRTDETSIQAQITTVWPKNTGGSKLAEQIEESLMSVLFPISNIVPVMTLPEPFNLWQFRFIGSPNVSYRNETNSVWIKQPIFNMTVSQD